MKQGFDIHNYQRRMELAVKKLQENNKVTDSALASHPNANWHRSD